MDFVTIAREIYAGTQLPLYCCEKETFEIAEISDRFRMIMIENGSGVLEINSNRIIFNAPEVFCIDRGERVRLLSPGDIKAFSVYFSPQAINSALDFENVRGDREGMSSTERSDCTCLHPFYHRDEAYHGKLSVGIFNFKTIKKLFESLAEELAKQRDGYWPCRSRSFLIELLFLFQKIHLGPNAQNEVLLNKTSGLVEPIVVYLHTNYEKKISVSDLSKLFNLNRTTLSEKFRLEMGMSAIAYLIDLRIRLSAMLLSDTMLSVAEISGRVGFNDITHFNRSFKKLMGHPPLEYRKINSWMLR